jgi:thiamine biosynthesis lipoprotein
MSRHALPPVVRSCALLATTALLLAIAGPAAAQTAADEGTRQLRLVKQTGMVFGGRVQIMAAGYTELDERLISAHFDDAFAELRRVEALLDAASETSDLGRINAAAGQEPVVVDAEVYQLLQEAVRVAELSAGAFDPTFAAFDGVWRFSSDDPVPSALPSVDGGVAPALPVIAPGSEPTVPPPALRDAYRTLIDFKKLKLDDAKRAVSLPSGMRVGLGGLAKGYALDKAAAVLEAKGVRDFVIAAGGDLVVRGSKGGESWWVGIQDPRAKGHFAAFQALPGAVMTTSDYERAFFEGGKRYHPIIDPRTGMPAEGCRSVTILAGDGLSADALATAVFVLGPKEGLRLVERLDGRAEVVIVTADNKVLTSGGIKDKLRYRAPTDGT